MKRYKCPRCDTGRLAPARMRKDDVRRYCLECSKETGRLVDMVCPARQKAREENRKSRAEKARQEREEYNRRFLTSDGQDTREILRAVKRLATWKREGEKVARAAKNYRPLERNIQWDGRIESEWVAVRFIEAIAAIALSVGDMAATPQNGDALVRAAGAEYFGLVESDLVNLHHTTRRFLHPEHARLHRMEDTVIAAAKAANSTGHSRPERKS